MRYPTVLLLTICSCAPEHPTTPVDCQRLLEERGYWSTAAVIAPAAVAVPLVIAASAKTEGARWTAMGVGLTLSGAGTVTVGQALSYDDAMQQCREVLETPSGE